MGVALIAGAGPGKTYVISANRAYQGDGGCIMFPLPKLWLSKGNETTTTTF